MHSRKPKRKAAAKGAGPDHERPCIATHVGPRAFAPRTRAALEGLGYRVVPAFATGDADTSEPLLRLVDERHYGEVPRISEDPRTPIIVLAGFRPLEIRDRRIIGSVTRPVELAALYPLLQNALEATPRTSPRVATALAARCVRADRRWMGSVVSLSDRGCLFQSSQVIDDGTQMNLQFALPNAGIITTRAVCVHRADGGAGLVFADPSAEDRHSIGGYVLEQLAARRPRVEAPRFVHPTSPHEAIVAGGADGKP